MAKITYDIKMADGYDDPVEGYSSPVPGLGIHKETAGVWVVTHIQSGRQLGSLRTRKSAEALCMSVSAFNWLLPASQLLSSLPVVRDAWMQEFMTTTPIPTWDPEKYHKAARRRVENYREEMKRVDAMPLVRGARQGKR